MSRELLDQARQLEERSAALLKDYTALQARVIEAKRRALDARDERGLMQIAVDSYVEAEETLHEVRSALDDVLDLSKDLLRELGDVK